MTFAVQDLFTILADRTRSLNDKRSFAQSYLIAGDFPASKKDIDDVIIDAELFKYGSKINGKVEMGHDAPTEADLAELSELFTCVQRYQEPFGGELRRAIMCEGMEAALKEWRLANRRGHGLEHHTQFGTHDHTTVSHVPSLPEGKRLTWGDGVPIASSWNEFLTELQQEVGPASQEYSDALKLALTMKPGHKTRYFLGNGSLHIAIGPKSGISVWKSAGSDATLLGAKLVPGAVVEKLEFDREWVHYRRLRGDGPDWGWVSASSLIHVRHKSVPARFEGPN